MNAKFEVCVGAAILRDGRLLLLRRSPSSRFFPGAWDLPGGHVEKGETLGRALRREVREETGWAIEIGPAIRAFEFDYPTVHGTYFPHSGPGFHVNFGPGQAHAYRV
jgi:mutator protein MutT